MAKALDEILQTYFGCKVAFRKDGELTTSGIKAYKKLEDLLNDLEGLGVIPSASDAIRVLDEITNEGKEDDGDGDLDSMEAIVKFVRKNLDEDDLDIIRAEANKCYKMHIIPDDSSIDCDAITEILDEYAEEHDLDEDWWEEYGDMSDIICEL